MPIGVNPDVRQLDFFDDVRVSKFMREQDDFKTKKWIRYATANAPSRTKPFTGGTYQFDTHMGVGHIIDTHYSGFYYTIRFTAPEAAWDLTPTLPRTSAAWIYQSSINHTNVPSNLNPCLHDFDCINTLFTDPVELETEELTYMHLRPAGERYEGYGCAKTDTLIGRYPKVALNGNLEMTFFIPLKNVNTIFNSNRYFFTNLLRGNGEFIIYLTSRAESLNQIFGGESIVFKSFKYADGTAAGHADDNRVTKVTGWKAEMVDLYLMTLNLDNDFINKEYNAFVYSGRKFVRSFKSYNCITKVIHKDQLNVIEIAHTHQSISHVALVFDNKYGFSFRRPSYNPADFAKGFERWKLPSSKQYYSLGNWKIKDFQVYRGTGNNEVMFSKPIDNMDELRRLTLEAIGNNSAHPYFTRKWFNHDNMAVIVISLNTFMREVSKTFWDGFSTTQTSDRLRIEFVPYVEQAADFDNEGQNENTINCRIFAFFDSVYYVDQQHCLNVTDTLNAIG